jgi:hypothetical protein
MIAAETSREGLQIERAKTPEHFHQLTLRVRLPDEVAVGHGASLQKTVIASQQNPVFALGQFDERSIVGVIAVGGVQTGQAQASRQLAQVDVGDEPGLFERPRSHAGQRADVECREPRKNGYPIAASDGVVEAHGNVVDEDQIDLRMGDAEAFDEILDGRMALD